MSTKKTQTSAGWVIPLSDGDRRMVLLEPADLDRFMMTQREVIETCRRSEKTLEKARSISDEFDRTIRDIREATGTSSAFAACWSQEVILLAA